MIQKLELSTVGKKILSFKVSGELDEVSFKKSTAQILSHLEDDEHFNIYLEIDVIDGLEYQIIWDSIKLAINNLGDYLEKVEKIAVVTDLKWFRIATKIENKLIPAISEKVFSSEQKEEAVAWLEA